jgi:hypothetical protein
MQHGYAPRAPLGSQQVVAQGVPVVLALGECEFVFGIVQQGSGQPVKKFARFAMATLICSRIAG